MAAMQKSVTHVVLQLLVENFIQKVMIISDDDRLLLATVKWAAEVKGFSYLTVYIQCPGEFNR